MICSHHSVMKSGEVKFSISMTFSFKVGYCVKNDFVHSSETDAI